MWSAPSRSSDVTQISRDRLECEASPSCQLTQNDRSLLLSFMYLSLSQQILIIVTCAEGPIALWYGLN